MSEKYEPRHAKRTRLQSIFKREPHWTVAALTGTYKVEGLGIDFEVERVTLPEGKTLHDYMVDTAHLEGAIYVDFGDSPSFPRFPMSDVDREKFLDGLRPVVEQIYADR